MKRSILQGLRYLGFRAERLNTGAATATHKGKVNVGGQIVDGPEKTRFFRYGFPGCPDIIFFVPASESRSFGVTVWVETKAPGKDLNDNQKLFQAFCLENHIPYIKAYSWDDVEGWLKKEGLIKTEGSR